jgi:hypothetical protein
MSLTEGFQSLDTLSAATEAKKWPGYEVTKGAIPLFAQQEIPYLILKKGKSIVVIAKSDQGKLFTLTLTGSQLAPLDTKDMAARLFLSHLLMKRDPLSSFSVLSPDTSLSHAWELKRMVKDKATKEKAGELIEEECQLLQEILEIPSPDKNAQIVKLRALCYKHTLSPSEEDKEQAKTLLSSLGTNPTTALQLGPDEKRLLLGLAPLMKNVIDSISAPDPEIEEPESPPLTDAVPDSSATPMTPTSTASLSEPTDALATPEPIETPLLPITAGSIEATKLQRIAEGLSIDLDSKCIPSSKVIPGKEHVQKALKQMVDDCRSALTVPKPESKPDDAYKAIWDGLEKMKAFDEVTISGFLKAADEKLETAQRKLNRNTAEVFGLITQGREGALSSESSLPALETLFVLYAQKNMKDLIRWGVPVDAIERIDSKIFEILNITQDLQKAKRVRDGLDKILKKPADFDGLRGGDYGVIKTAKGMRVYKPEDHREFQLFEVLSQSGKGLYMT